MLVLRVLALAAGLAAIVSFFLSSIRASLLVRHRQEWLAKLVIGLVHRLFRLGLGRARSYAARDYVLVYEAPVMVIALIAAWFVLVTLGFAAIFWAVGSISPSRAFIISGMSLSTLGSVTPDTDLGKVIAVMEGGIGLGIVALLIAFLPEFYVVVTQREDDVSYLASRLGAVPSGSATIEWYYRAGQAGQISDLWSRWQTWFVELEETHTSLSLLAYFRSFARGQSWVTTAGAVLDAAALFLSTVDQPGDICARLMLDIGSHALQRIAAALDISIATPPSGVTRAQYDAACDRLLHAGVPLKANRDQAWRDLTALRSGYEGALAGLAQMVEASLPPWP